MLSTTCYVETAKQGWRPLLNACRNSHCATSNGISVSLSSYGDGQSAWVTAISTSFQPMSHHSQGGVHSASLPICFSSLIRCSCHSLCSACWLYRRASKRHR